jgi:hypothetical protein
MKAGDKIRIDVAWHGMCADLQDDLHELEEGISKNGH